MLHANPKTRRQNATAGESVDVEGYLRKMADNATDGDHLTLQVREKRGGARGKRPGCLCLGQTGVLCPVMCRVVRVGPTPRTGTTRRRCRCVSVLCV